MKHKPKNRLELEERLAKEGFKTTLFRDDESRDKAKWILKQQRMGNLRKTIVYDKP